MQRIEARLGRSMGALLQEMYVERELTLDEIATEWGLTKGVISRWLERFGIDRRSTGWRRKASA